MTKQKIKGQKIDLDLYELYKNQQKRIDEMYKNPHYKLSNDGSYYPFDWEEYFNTDQTVREIVSEELKKRSIRNFNNFVFYILGLLTPLFLWIIYQIIKKGL